ncbi:unnamed protein product [Nippostrongylus brasiliensis]|uniref:Uncharacterized protein n=1 Tax=Nippostrongylus brasiliensis TaxID=27835 RepID=A0A0N4YNC8_NIPBR|nr:unnamed protein product [Nippostrongylus brasiliensis]
MVFDFCDGIYKQLFHETVEIYFLLGSRPIARCSAPCRGP